MRSDTTIFGALGSWCSVPLRPGPVGLLPGKTHRPNVDRGGATAGRFCWGSCGVGCRVVLSGQDRGLLGVGGVGRRVRRVLRAREKRLDRVNRGVRGFIPSRPGM